jgi:proton glutamate symport protein
MVATNFFAQGKGNNYQSRIFSLTLTHRIMLGLIFGVALGLGINSFGSPEYLSYIEPFSALFVRLIKMIIAPIVFCCLVNGIAAAGHVKTVGRMGARALLYFEVVTGAALLIGLLTVNILRPGDGISLPTGVPAGIEASAAQSWQQMLLHLVPTSVIKAMADGDVLQIVVFSALFGVAVGMMGERGSPIIDLCERVADASFRLCGLIMQYAPIGVAAAMACAIGRGGLGVLWNLGALVGALYISLVVFVLCVLLPVAIWARIPLRRFFAVVKEPLIIAFSTTSSEAALPKAIENLEAFGVPRRIVSFVLPLGYSFNLDGSTLYLSLAAVFVAQVAQVELTLMQQLMLVGTLMITSKGVAAVPRASFVILAATLADYHLPLEGLTLILGVDVLMDMARTTVNVLGNCLATVLVARWEGELRLPGEEAVLLKKEVHSK